MGLSRVRFPARRMMFAVALMVLVAGGTVLAMRRGVNRGRAGFYAHQEEEAARQFFGSEKAPSPAAELKKNAQFVSDLSPDGRVESPGSPEAVRIAAAKATGLFREVRWDEFVAVAERLDGPGEWTGGIEPKSGERDDIVWVRGEGIA